jgi:hypothetical protein
MKLKLKEFISIEAENANPISACYYLLETEPASGASRGSISRDFVTGKLPTAFDSSISMHFIHKSALYISALLISSILSL